MKYYKLFRESGEPTFTIPLYLCQETREKLPDLWCRQSTVEEMREEIRQSIEPIDRYEYLVLDDEGKLRAMMVILPHYNPHHGVHLYTAYSFSADPGLLAGGYRWMVELGKGLSCDGVLFSRQVGEFEMSEKYKRLKHE
ncbi:hypothetical protein L8P30_09965 [Enterobacter asburiae]|uniref:hypothetical protein n=1 Tax=Enterobacter asburiae TaxID=61645 RepID=UPI0020061A1E|nr:hypothetical protein [Enterobacter asburiae]MCK7142576.1 hypothetical protein [Enterobacter asburiae]